MPYNMQRNKISFKGQKIYVGIDVHLKNWSVTVITEKGLKRTHPQKADAKELFEFLNRHYPEGEYLAVYESGFSGFSTYYALKEAGIDSVVIHAADVPTTQYEDVMKTDVIDSEKLARSLRAGLLRPIYIRKKENLDDRSVVRIRKTIQRKLAGDKARIKHMLHQNGVEIPEGFARSAYWSGAFIKWLREDVRLLSSTRLSLDLLIDQVLDQKRMVLKCTRTLRELSTTPKYRDSYKLLTTIPGVGSVVAMSILTEIYDITRFRNERQFASYLGLIPTCHSSGEKVSHGEKTFRGNKKLGPMVVEASWIAVARDPRLNALYGTYCQRMKCQEAIIRVARRMSNIIFGVLKNNTGYVPAYTES